MEVITPHVEREQAPGVASLITRRVQELLGSFFPRFTGGNSRSSQESPSRRLTHPPNRRVAAEQPHRRSTVPPSAETPMSQAATALNFPVTEPLAEYSSPQSNEYWDALLNMNFMDNLDTILSHPNLETGTGPGNFPLNYADLSSIETNQAISTQSPVHDSAFQVGEQSTQDPLEPVAREQESILPTVGSQSSNSSTSPRTVTGSPTSPEDSSDLTNPNSDHQGAMLLGVGTSEQQQDVSRVLNPTLAAPSRHHQGSVRNGEVPHSETPKVSTA